MNSWKKKIEAKANLKTRLKLRQIHVYLMNGITQAKKFIFVLFLLLKKKTRSLCCKKMRSFTSVICVYRTEMCEEESEIKIISLRFCYDLPADVS